ncbi:MAG: vanadium-dependent haloperoxidase [Bryobacteraceae bacterium]
MFYYDRGAQHGASDEAAAIAAAHRVLVYYFPSQKSDLDGKYTFSMASVAANASAKAAGISVGEAAADALIAARTGDGLEASVPYLPGSEPGVWQPTPPGFLPPAAPWLAHLRPFTLESPSQFRPGGPLALSSEEWVADFNVTRLFGELNSSLRTPKQTEVGLFWTEHPPQQYARAWNYLIKNYRLDLMDSARLLAILWTSGADSLIGCFDAKYKFGFWRPVTAIAAGGANPELAAHAAWLPLGITPNHPEYPAAHACATSAFSNSVKNFFGTPKVHVVVDSVIFKDGVHTHSFEDTREWADEVFWARIFVGFHFIHSLRDGTTLGEQVSRRVNRTAFQSVRRTPDR